MGNVHVTPEKDARRIAAHVADMEESHFLAWARVVALGLEARADECEGEERRKLSSLAQAVREQLTV
jgi:alkylated DNA nucleotide flippase Atl1